MAHYFAVIKENMIFASSGGTMVTIAPNADRIIKPPPPGVLPSASKGMDDIAKNACFSWRHEGSKPNRVAEAGCRIRGMGMDYQHVMPVFDEVVLERATVVTLQQKRIDLPLKPDFVLDKRAIDSGHIPDANKGLWQLETELDESLLVVFAYQITSEGVLPLPQQDVLKLGEKFMPDPGAPITEAKVDQSLKVATGPLRVLVCFAPTFCKERPDFEPGGAVGMNRIYPVVMTMASQALASIEVDIIVRRQSKSPHAGAMPDPAPPPTDLSPPNDPIQAMDTMLPDIQPNFFTDSNRKRDTDPLPPLPFWDIIFDYYEVNSIKNGVGTTTPVTMVDRSKSGFRADFVVKKQQRGDTFSTNETLSPVKVLKFPFQGEFDNMHMAPPMKVGIGPIPTLPPEMLAERIAMAPFCVHDCLHMHTRWGLLLPQKFNKGFDAQGNPHRVEGSPLVPRNQTVKLLLLPSAGQIGYRYSVEADAPRAGEWTVCFHHGMAYPNDMWGQQGDSKVFAARLGIEKRARADNEHDFGSRDAMRSWATFYWRMRYGGTQGKPVERIDADLAAARKL